MATNQVNPFAKISNTLAEELTASRHVAEKSRTVGSGMESVDMAPMRRQFEMGTPQQRAAIIESMKKNKDDPTKLHQLVQGWRGKK